QLIDFAHRLDRVEEAVHTVQQLEEQTMSKREYKLENRESRALSESQLTQTLRDCFTEQNSCNPSPAQEEGLREAAQCVREGTITWREVKRAIHDHTWEPVEGPRAILGSG